MFKARWVSFDLLNVEIDAFVTLNQIYQVLYVRLQITTRLSLCYGVITV